MADLENFFAKKDKKKTKPKKFTPEEVVKKIEEAEKKQCERDKKEELKRKQERDEQLENVYPTTGQVETAEEWHDDVEEEVDVSDLNIQQLQQSDPTSNQSQAELNGDANSSRQAPGPWSKVTSSSTSASSSDSEDDETETASAVAGSNTAGSSTAAAVLASSASATDSPSAVAASTAGTAAAPYVAPHQRQRGSSAAGAGASVAGAARRRAGGKTKAPDITSDEAFPSLAAAAPDVTAAAAVLEREQIRCGGAFQQVRYGGQASSQDARFNRTKVTLGNQFDGLRLNDAS